MTEHLRKPFLVYISFVMMSLSVCPALAQQDCFDAISVCSNTYTQSTSYSGYGAEQEVDTAETCLGSGEVNSVWYTFTVTNSGTLGFQLNPINPGDDYDFALYNLTNDSCLGISNGISQPVSCNYSADSGPTGVSPSGIGISNGSSDPNQNALVNVQANETYALLVSNYTSSQSGYTLDFSGSSSIVDNQAATPDSISMRSVCNPRDIYLFFDEPFDCNSISSDGSEITVTGPSTTTVANVSGIGCSQGFTNQIRIRLTGKIQTAGTYTITITSGSDGDSFTDGCGNQVVSGSTFQFTVDFIGPDVDIINVVHTSCGQDDGQAEADVTNGSAPFTYSWNSSPSQTTATATALEPGVYKVTVIDDNGCRDQASVTIDNNSPIDLTNYSVTPVSCNGSADGTAELIPSGGAAPYDISWNTNPTQTGQSVSNLNGGNILVTITDDTGCEEQITINIPEPNAIGLSTSIVNPDCGVSNGAATVNATGGNGGFVYEWNSSPTQSTATATNLAAGVYSVMVTDINGCSQSISAILADNFAPNATIENRVSDCGQGIGQATAVATSGVAPYSYSWSTTPPQNNSTATGLSEGDYFVTITDANNCVQIVNVKIDLVPPPAISLTITQPTCGNTDGEVEATVANGVNPLTYSWSSSSNNSNIETGLGTGTYDITVVDSTGCTSTETFMLQELPPQSEITTTSVCLGEESTFSFTTTSGATSWVWDFGDGNTSTDQSPTHTYSSPGNQTVTLTLDGGCLPHQVTASAEVFEPPTADFTYSPEIPTTRSSIEFVNTGTGGTSFLWDFGDGTTLTGPRPSYQYEIDGSYDVLLTVTDDNGCQDTITVNIEILLAPVIYFPNAIIVEGTETNNHFQGYGIGVISAELSVFDRWGTLVFFSASINEIMTTGWDGKFNGQFVKQGAYPYKVKASFYNGSSFEKLGTVTVIR